MTELQSACASAVGEMACLQYFPGDELGRAAIMRMIERMANSPAEVEWLARYMVDRVGVWTGPVALRGVFCSRFKPKDKKEEDPPPAVAAANEARFLENHEERKALAAPGVMALLKAAESGDSERWDRQNQRWYELCETDKNIPRVFRRLSNEFATTADLDRRDWIIGEIKTKLQKQEVAKESGENILD